MVIVKDLKKAICLLLIATMLSGMTVRSEPAYGFAPVVWALVGPLLSLGANKLFNPDRNEITPASSPILMLETPDGKALPPILASTQRVVILRKGVRISSIKPGAVGMPIKEAEFFVDGGGETVTVKEYPFEAGTTRGDKMFDTSDTRWKVGGAYTLNMVYKTTKKAANIGQDGFTAIQVVVVDETFLTNAITDPMYREYLAYNTGATPIIPVSNVVRYDPATGAIEVGTVVGNEPRSFMSNPTPPVAQEPPTVQVGPGPGSKPIEIEKRGGMQMQYLMGGRPFEGTVTLTTAQAKSTPLVVDAGPLAQRMIIKVMDNNQGGKKIYEKLVNGQTYTISLSDQPASADLTILSAAQAADKTQSPVAELRIKITK